MSFANYTRCPYCLRMERQGGECGACGHTGICSVCGGGVLVDSPWPDLCGHECRDIAAAEDAAERAMDLAWEDRH